MAKPMETAKRRTALGQGLDALIPAHEPAEIKELNRTIAYVSADSLLPNPFQPRRSFDETSLLDLSESIKERGVIQPLIVRAASSGTYEIVAGERRWRAARMAGFSTVPVIVRNVSDSESLEIALIENLQREDLNPLDTAEAYDILIKKFSYTHEDLAKRMGKDRSNVTNYLRLLKLPDPIKEQLRQDLITMGHARTLLAIDHLPTQLQLSGKVVKRNLSVRELERIIHNYRKKQDGLKASSGSRSSDLSELESRLSRHMATRVVIRKKINNSGRLEIYFHSSEEFDRLLELLGYSEDFA
jgi:ParB family chromosome partitioning protein